MKELEILELGHPFSTDRIEGVLRDWVTGPHPLEGLQDSNKVWIFFYQPNRVLRLHVSAQE